MPTATAGDSGGRPGSSSGARPGAAHAREMMNLKQASNERARLLGDKVEGQGSGLGSLFAGLLWTPGEDPESDTAPAAITTLALMWESAEPGSERELLCECVRESGGIPRLLLLVAHPNVRTKQATLLLLDRLMDDANDRRGARETRKLVKGWSRSMSELVKCLFENNTLTVVNALGAVQRLCAGDLEQIQKLVECGAIARLRELMRCDQPTLASGAAACMEHVMANVRSSETSVKMTAAVVRVQSRYRRRIARKNYGIILKAAARLQAAVRAKPARLAYRAHLEQKEEERLQHEALIILRLRLGAPLRQRLKERAAAARARAKEAMVKRLAEMEKAQAAGAAAETEAARLREAKIAKREEERQAAARAIKEAKEAKAKARAAEQQAAKAAEDEKERLQQEAAARREEKLKAKEAKPVMLVGNGKRPPSARLASLSHAPSLEVLEKVEPETVEAAKAAPKQAAPDDQAAPAAEAPAPTAVASSAAALAEQTAVASESSSPEATGGGQPASSAEQPAAATLNGAAAPPAAAAAPEAAKQ